MHPATTAKVVDPILSLPTLELGKTDGCEEVVDPQHKQSAPLETFSDGPNRPQIMEKLSPVSPKSRELVVGGPG